MRLSLYRATFGVLCGLLALLVPATSGAHESRLAPGWRYL
jgi:hypothetical protein